MVIYATLSAPPFVRPPKGYQVLHVPHVTCDISGHCRGGIFLPCHGIPKIARLRGSREPFCPKYPTPSAPAHLGVYASSVRKIASPACAQARYRGFTLDGTPDFLEHMIETDRSLSALYALSSKSDALAIREAVDDAALGYEALLAVQEARCVADGQAFRLQMALDLLRAKLRSFGHPV